MNTLYPTFYRHIRGYCLIEPGDTVILGLSGGKDSVALFYLLRELQKDVDFQLTAAYFNHKLRSDENQEERWVREFCASAGVKLVVGGKNIREFKENNKLNLEHAASISRYIFFREVSASLDGKAGKIKVATAHTKSDLTETFFIKLFRGSGLQGLSTIYHKKENAIIRPLLLFDENEILSFLERNNIEFYEDYTNRDETFMRNRIRHRLVGAVREIEPNIHDRIFRTVNIIQAEYDYLGSEAEKHLKKHLLLDKILPASALDGLHIAMQRHAVREYLRKLKGNLLNIDFNHIEAVRTQHAEVGGIAIPGIELAFHKGFIYPNGLTIGEYDYLIAPLPENKTGKQITIKETAQRLKITRDGNFVKPRDNNRIILSRDQLKFPLRLRSPKKEDKYIKINSAINQKVFEMIRASGMPHELRNLCPVLENGDGEIIWVKGSPVADRFKTTPGRSGGHVFLKLAVTR